MIRQQNNGKQRDRRRESREKKGEKGLHVLYSFKSCMGRITVFIPGVSVTKLLGRVKTQCVFIHLDWKIFIYAYEYCALKSESSNVLRHINNQSIKINGKEYA